jgi:hypothetical protein
MGKLFNTDSLSQHGLQTPKPDKLSRWIFFREVGSPLIDLINTKYILMPPDSIINSDKFKLVYENEISIYENKNAFSRFFFVPDYYLVNNTDEAYNVIGNFSRDGFLKKVVLEKEPLINFEKQSEDSYNLPEPDIDVISKSMRNIVLRIKSDQSGFLVISNNYHPGWKATIDGKKTEILLANYFMQAIPVLQGNHTIKLNFNPIFLTFGLKVTVISWIILLSTTSLYIGFLIYRKYQIAKKSEG